MLRRLCLLSLLCYLPGKAWSQTECQPSPIDYARFDESLGTLTISTLSVDNLASPLFTLTAYLSEPASMRFEVINVQPLPLITSTCPARFSSVTNRLDKVFVSIGNEAPIEAIFQADIAGASIQLSVVELLPTQPRRTNILPSSGQGGTILAGRSGLSPSGAEIHIPSNYTPETLASPVLWLFNETVEDWQHATANDAAILVDLQEYNNIPAIAQKLGETRRLLEAEYNVDMGRYYWAGWSAGGNIAVIFAAASQDRLAGVMVFPGTGGNLALTDMATREGHKMRLYYACGSNDALFNCNNVQFEAETWRDSFGYETRYEFIQGASHYIDEVTYRVRANAWAWMAEFNLLN